MSTLGTRRIQEVELHWPEYGAALARVTTEAGSVPVGPATLTIGDLSLVGAVLPDRAGEDAPASWSGVWKSGAAWDTVLPVKPPHQSDDGVRLKTVIAALVLECGSPAIVAPADRALGAHWCRPKRDAAGLPWTGADELAALARARALLPWWVTAAGVTRFDARPAGTITAASRVSGRSLTRGVRTIGVDSPVAFAPGLTFEGARIARIIVRDSGGGSPTLELWTS
jgi:hypothetical protein